MKARDLTTLKYQHLYAQSIRFARQSRDGAREDGISPKIRQMRKDMMRFWARLAVRYYRDPA